MPDVLCLWDVFVFLQLCSVLVSCLYQQNSGLLPHLFFFFFFSLNKHLLLLLIACHKLLVSGVLLGSKP